MRDFLVEQSQPFGQVNQVRTMPGTPCDYGFSGKSLGDTTVRNNNGGNHAPSLSNPNPNAEAKAHAHIDNPFFWTGKPVGGT